MQQFTPIREMLPSDLEAVADIWLTENKNAHSFIPAAYWERHLEPVKAALLQADVAVWEDRQGIGGFAGMQGDWLAGIFVRASRQSCGIGKALLNHFKAHRAQISLSVYQKNMRAIRFYQREGFAVLAKGVDADTGETEYTMRWQR